MREPVFLLLYVLLALQQAVAMMSRGGGDGGETDPAAVKFEVDRWKSLTTYCLGHWSGSIGWFDVVQPSEEEEELKLVARPDNNQLNMRMSFQLRKEDDTVGDWIVYHARSKGSKDHVVIEKHPLPGPSPPLQMFYCFEDGIIGRCGRNMKSFPVVEHGFWSDGVRKTVVLVFNKKTLCLEKICFLKQIKKHDDSFDVSAVILDDISVLPTGSDSQLSIITDNERNKLKTEWNVDSIKIQRCQIVNNLGRNPEEDSDTNALTRCLSVVDDTMLHLLLPNGVVLACPKSLSHTTTKPVILLGHQRPGGQVQVLEIQIESTSGMINNVRASCYQK